MDPFDLARRTLMCLDPEQAHQLALNGFNILEKLHCLNTPEQPKHTTSCLGLTFPNAIGLAAGFDKDGKAIHALSALGFGHIEVGTVTPKPQPGNPKPRLFRLTEDQAIINRMGFNNDGVHALINRLEKRPFSGILGINIGKNKLTEQDDAHLDYLYCLQHAYPYADYITINVSSPNTAGLRDLQQEEAINHLLSQIKERSIQLSAQHGKHVPLVLKIAPDLTLEEIDSIVSVIQKVGFDGIIASNTTIARPEALSSQYAQKAGGLSGAPLTTQANTILAHLHQSLGPTFPIIGVGGTMSADDAKEKFTLGANLVQLYSGFIYHGPALLKACLALS